jgi:hypothetical protein
MHEGVELFLGNGAYGNEVIPESAAVLGESRQCFRDVVFCDELCADQQIP